MIRKGISVFTLFFYVFTALDLSSIGAWGMDNLTREEQRTALLAARNPECYRRTLQTNRDIRNAVKPLLKAEQRRNLPPYKKQISSALPDGMKLERASAAGDDRNKKTRSKKGRKTVEDLIDDDILEVDTYCHGAFQNVLELLRFQGEYYEDLYNLSLDVSYLTVGIFNAANVVLIAFDLKIPVACVSFSSSIVELTTNFFKKIHDRRQAKKKQQQKKLKKASQENLRDLEKKTFSKLQSSDQKELLEEKEESNLSKARSVQKSSFTYGVELAADLIFIGVAILNFIVIILTLNNQTEAVQGLSVAAFGLQTLGLYLKKDKDRQSNESLSKRETKIKDIEASCRSLEKFSANKSPEGSAKLPFPMGTTLTINLPPNMTTEEFEKILGRFPGIASTSTANTTSNPSASQAHVRPLTYSERQPDNGNSDSVRFDLSTRSEED